MIIQKLDGTIMDLSDYGLTRLYHRIPTPDIQHTNYKVDGYGEMNTGTIIGQRKISTDVLFKVDDIYDYYLLRDELTALFATEEPFYLIFRREGWKRWKVKIAAGFQLPPTPNYGAFSMEFQTISKYAESINDTLSATYGWDEGDFGTDGSVDMDESYSYVFDSDSFTVVNRGNVVIDPREPEVGLEVTIKGTAASSFIIRNATTNDYVTIQRTLTENDVITLDNIGVYLNGGSIFKDTNKQVLTLAPGDNYFIVSGINVIEIKFKFRHLYI